MSAAALHSDEDSAPKLQPTRNIAARSAAEGAIAPYAGDVVEMLERGCDDSCPEVVFEACGALEALVHALGRRLGAEAKRLAWSFIPNLTHKCAQRTRACSPCAAARVRARRG